MWPFAIGLCIFAIAYLKRDQGILTEMLGFCLFFWPMLLGVAVVGVISALYAMVHHSKYLSVLLVYLMVILGFLILGFCLLAGLDPI